MLTQQGQPLLRVEDLTVVYRPSGRTPVAAVSEVGFEVWPGEIVMIVGESGSGKSSIASALIGLSVANAQLTGRIVLNGEEVSHASERTWRRLRGRTVGFVPQDPSLSLDPVKRIGTQVAEALEVHGLPAHEAGKRVTELLEDVGLGQKHVAASYPHELSGGMRQRVLVAIGLANAPPLLIADEPTSGLDVTVQRRLLDHMEQLIRRKGTAVLLITHDLAMAADRADRIIVMRAGRIVEAGPTRTVFTAPRHPYTAQLINATTRKQPARTHCPTTAASPILVVEGLTKQFNRGWQDGIRKAVDKVSFEVARHGTTSIVGESGSGKSTTARIIMRLEAATAGSVRFDGQEILGLTGKALKEFRQRVQIVQQNPYASLDPRLSIEEIIAEPLYAFSLGDRVTRQMRVRELLDNVGLPERVRTSQPTALSGGQRQRVAIARALAIKPELVVLDEPVSALDASVQLQILSLLAQLQNELGVSYLCISHDLEMVREISDHVVVLRRGQVVEQGSVQAIFESPSDPYTKALLNDAPGHRHVWGPAAHGQQVKLV